MGVMDLARKLLNRQSQKHSHVFSLTSAEIEAKLEALGWPRDPWTYGPGAKETIARTRAELAVDPASWDPNDPLYDEARSFLQYRAQRSQAPWLFVFYNVASFFVYYFERFRQARRTVGPDADPAGKTDKTVKTDKTDKTDKTAGHGTDAPNARGEADTSEAQPNSRVPLVYYIYDADRGLMPQSLLEAYPGSRHVYASEQDLVPSLAPQDLALLRALGRRRPFSYYYRLKVLMRLGINRSLIRRYQPEAIAQCGEYSFASSLCTHQLEREGILHLNLLHGEKLLCLRDSYVRFTRFYLWDAHYESLFLAMRCPPKQMVQEKPPALLPRVLTGPKAVDYCYYLANESPAQLQAVLGAMLKLAEAGRTVALRPHPRYSDLGWLEEHVPPEMMEPQGLSLDESLARSGGAISLYSTVLNQAAAAGLEIVIDDVKDPELYEALDDLGYKMIREPHRRLSELLG